MNPTAQSDPRSQRGLPVFFTAVVLIVASTLAATGVSYALATTCVLNWLQQAEQVKPAAKFPAGNFKDWGKPDLVIVLSGQQNGYLLPCGCSSPQVGGLERRYNLVQMFKANGWPWTAVDLGDIPQKSGPVDLPNQQGMIKYLYSMRALKAMNYATVGFGTQEVNLGLDDVLANWALNEEPKVVSTNLMDAEKNFPGMVEPWKPVWVKEAGIHVGVVAITDPSKAAQIKEMTRNDKKLLFGATGKTLDAVGKQLTQSKVGLPIMLYYGPATRNEKNQPLMGGVACAEQFPEFRIVLCHSQDPDPPANWVEVKTKAGTTSYVVTVGQKGKFVGVVGVWKTGKKEDPYRFRYQRVEMTEDFLTPKDKRKDHPIVALMEQYTAELRDQKYLEKYGQVRHTLQVMPEVAKLRNPGDVTFVGSDKCKKCHEHAYEVWQKTPHSHAYKTLADAKNPGNRQYDPECIVCHTVGFGYQGGFITDKRSANLKDVGCESCHGPSSLHVRNPENEEWKKRINPWKYLPKDKRESVIDQMCQKCHDEDNDVTWLNNGFKKKWPKVEHMTPLPPADE